MCERLDEVLAYHCAPVLMGRKAANLVCLSRWTFPDLYRQAAAYDLHFQPRGIRFRVMTADRRGALLLVWHQRLMPAQLESPMAQAILRRAGYAPQDGVEALLVQLGERLRSPSEFPHEIGLFLGYPPEDVEGFRIHRGRDCKLCGYWKVYSDVPRARALFRQYDRCRAALYPRVAAGLSLEQIFFPPDPRGDPLA